MGGPGLRPRALRGRNVILAGAVITVSALAGVARGAEIVRVHDVGETVQALEVAKGLALIDRID